MVNTTNEFQNLCSIFGITHQLTCSHTQKQNRVTELKQIIETTLTLLSKATIPHHIGIWSYVSPLQPLSLLPSNILHYSVEVEIL